VYSKKWCSLPRHAIKPGSGDGRGRFYVVEPPHRRLRLDDGTKEESFCSPKKSSERLAAFDGLLASMAANVNSKITARMDTSE
jgi:hypothetical protein